MDLGQTSNFVNPAQIDTELLSQMPSQVTPYTVENVLAYLGRAIPAVSINQRKHENAIVVEIPGVKHIKISPAEDIPVVGFHFLAFSLSREIEELINVQDFPGALSRVNKIFDSARNYISKAPRLATQIVNKLIEFCQLQRSSLEAIARWLGADGYSISMTLPPSISFSFPLVKETNITVQPKATTLKKIISAFKFGP